MKTELPIIERLRTRLPVCPFDSKAPRHDLEASDPCPVCNDYGDERSKNLCRGADTRCMDEAADTIEALVEALTPSAETKAAYSGEFRFSVTDRDEDGEEVYRKVLVPWTIIKEIMAAIRARAAA